MPLLLLCGLPSSGKSKRAASIAKYFNDNGRQAVVFDDSTVSPNFDKNEVFSDALREKELRSEMLSAVQRKLGKTRVLIIDSLNYIKGYRYELYCSAKAAQTTFCVVFCECTPEIVVKWNELQERKDSGQLYSPLVLQSLIDRFEAPDPSNRWDTPLISVVPDMLEPPFAAIDAALFKTKPPKQNKATLSAPVAPTNVSYDIDRISQDIINAFSSQLKKVPLSEVMFLQIPYKTEPLKIRCKNEAGLVPQVSEADLQRHRRDFISLFRSRTHIQASSSDSSNIPQFCNLFVAFLESRLFPSIKQIDNELGFSN